VEGGAIEKAAICQLDKTIHMIGSYFGEEFHGDVSELCVYQGCFCFHDVDLLLIEGSETAIF
jgi:hypothetical protein